MCMMLPATEGYHHGYVFAPPFIFTDFFLLELLHMLMFNVSERSIIHVLAKYCLLDIGTDQ